MQANMLATRDLAERPMKSADLIDLMVEAKKLAFVDRDDYVCDPDTHPVPVEEMLPSPDQGLRQYNRTGSGGQRLDAQDLHTGR